MSDILERKIHFHVLTCRRGSSSVDMKRILERIDKLEFKEGRGGRYFPKSDGNLWTLFVDSLDNPNKARLGTIRRNALPLIEGKGKTSPLKLPSDSQGLFEPSHFVVFPNGIVGSEFNFYGPRIVTLRAYLPAIADQLVDEVEVLPLIKKDIQKTLSEIGEITQLRLRAYRSINQELSHLNPNLREAFKSLKNTTDADSIEVVFRTEKWARAPLKVPFREKIASWLSKPEVRENISKFTLRGRNVHTEEMQEFDLMQNFVVSTRQVVKQDRRHKSVDTHSMYDAIEDAYKEKKAEIREAISLEHLGT